MAEVIFTDGNFQTEVLDSKGLVLVDFFAVWCGPCKMLAPIIDELAEEYDGKAKIGKINVDESPETSQKYGVQSIPTLILFKGGEEVERMVGFQGKDSLKGAIDSNL